jgi:predicted  nucleic acid-binding Zn-ribbon protein
LNQLTSDQKVTLASQQKSHHDTVQKLQQEIQQWQEQLKSKEMEMGWLETDVEGYEVSQSGAYVTERERILTDFFGGNRQNSRNRAIPSQ